MKMTSETFKKLKAAIEDIHWRNITTLNTLFEAEGNICVCTVCGHTGTGADFTVATGGDDFVGQCPKCNATDDKILDIDE